MVKKALKWPEEYKWLQELCMVKYYIIHNLCYNLVSEINFEFKKKMHIQILQFPYVVNNYKILSEIQGDNIILKSVSTT